MKKFICMLLALTMIFALAACAQKHEAETETEMTEWTRQGYFQDESGENLFYVLWMEDADESGWYAGVMMGELMAGGTVALEGSALKGEISTWEDGAEPISITVTEEGEDGVEVVLNGEAYHFTPYDIPDATIFVSINTEGRGMIGYQEGETAPELDPERPYQSAQVNLAEPATYTFAAAPEEGNKFVKWTKNGEDFSTDAVVTVLLDESADFVAVFEADTENTGRQDGERFEAVIILEGMEETVQYEHVVNETLGFEMDYDYESLERKSESDRERFVSVWDDADDPENYLEVTYSEEDAETAAAAVREELSQKYDLIEESRELDNAGNCIYIEASALKGTDTLADQLQAVYIIPASDGCRIAAAHFSAESAEGFGRRFAYMMQTFSAI